jgi:hypothetical protein
VDVDVAAAAGLFADRTRADLVAALLDGRAPHRRRACASNGRVCRDMTRRPRQRAVRVEPAGRRGLLEVFGCDLTAIEAPTG